MQKYIVTITIGSITSIIITVTTAFNYDNNIDVIKGTLKY